MTSLTLFVSDAFRPKLLEQLQDNAPFQTVLCVNSAAECCADATSVRSDALIIDFSCITPAKAQDLMQQMETADYHPALMIFELQDGHIVYTLSAADAIPLSDSLESFFLSALGTQYPCSRWYFRSAAWPEENTKYVSSERSTALVELMYGAAPKEAQYYLSRYQLDLRESGYYAYFWELNYTLYTDHFCYKDIYHFIGFRLLETCRQILSKYSGGEAFYINLTQICVLINDFRLSSETQNRRRLNVLLSELTATTDSKRAAHYVSKKFRSVREFRSVYDTYLSERRMSFFNGKDLLFGAAPAETVVADPKEINLALDTITKYLNYDINNPELNRELHRLFFEILKPARDFPMYYYAASVLTSKLMQTDPRLEKATISKRMDANHLRHTSIEDEYEFFCRAIEDIRQQSGSARQSKSTLMMKAMDFIRNNYRENILVSDIAGALYVSETYLSRISKTLTGKSMIQNLVDYRVSQAKIALAEEDVAIYTIAEQCGFRDVRHFSKTFKKLTGQSPTEYRRSHF